MKQGHRCRLRWERLALSLSLMLWLLMQIDVAHLRALGQRVVWPLLGVALVALVSAHPRQAASPNFGNWRGAAYADGAGAGDSVSRIVDGGECDGDAGAAVGDPGGVHGAARAPERHCEPDPTVFNNLGARSGAFFVMLQPLGIAAAAVAALSLLVYLVRMGVSCLGGVLYIVGSVTGSGADLAAPLSRSPAQKV